jgi:hypothetical protein
MGIRGIFGGNRDMIRTPFHTASEFADALFAGFFRRAQDGRKVVHPWGSFVKGYVIPSEEDERRMKQQFAAFLVVVPILVFVIHAFWGFPGSLAAGALIVAGYAIQVRRLTASMEPSGEGLSLTESYRALALKHSPTSLWSWMVVGLFCICFGILASVLGSENRESFAFLIGVGVFLVVSAGYFFVLRRGANPTAADTSLTGEAVAAEEAAASITGNVGPVRLWFMTIIGLMFTGLGIFLFVIDPSDRLESAGFTAMFGLIAGLGIALLVLRHRQRHD